MTKQQTPKNVDEALSQAIGKSGGTAMLHIHRTHGLEMDIKNYLADGKNDEEINSVDWQYKFYAWSILKILGPGYYAEHLATKFLGNIPPRSENSTTDWERVYKCAIARGMPEKDVDEKVAIAIQVKNAVSHYSIINPSCRALDKASDFKKLVDLYKDFPFSQTIGIAKVNYNKIIKYYDNVYDNLSKVEKYLKRAYRL